MGLAEDADASRFANDAAPTATAQSHAAPAEAQLTQLEVDLVHGSVRAAANFAAVLGFELAREGDLEALGRRALARVAVTDRERVESALRALGRGGSMLSLRFEVDGADGTARAIDSTWSVLRDGSGSARIIAATFLDRSAHRRVGDTLHESEARYRLALTAGRMGSWETDLIAGTRTWTQEGMALFGLSLCDGRGIVGGAADEYRNAMHPDDRHLMAHFHALADAQDSFAAEYRIVRPDGTLLWLAGRGLVVARAADGRARRLVSIMADVTERRHAEEELRIERERLGLALNAGQMGAFDLNIAGDTLWWSPQTYAVFGLSPDSFTPTRESVIALVHPDDRRMFVQRRSEAIAQHRPLALEFRILRPDQRPAWVSHRGQVEYDAKGRPVRSFGITMDVTERKLAEHALQEADRKKDDFIATLAHELRNPLAPIRNAVEVLRRTGEGGRHVAWARDLIDRQVAQMAHLLDDLLDVSRMTRGRFQLRREPLDLAIVIEQAIEIAQPTIDAARHTLSVELPSTALDLQGDMTRLAQVVSNLLINAAKYTASGGQIRLSAEPDGDEVVLRVRDNGIGIAAEQMPHIFEMFGQVESALERSQGGLGIGLSLAKGLVELHGGTISAHSEGVGHGSEFVVRLPLVARHAGASVRAAAPATAAPEGGCRLLVADDLREIADSLAKVLTLMGHTVQVAYDGEQAVRIAETFRPEVALLDLGMPKLNGYEACRRIRSTDWGRRITVIAQTGWGQDEDRRRTREAGFDHHVLKPVDPGALVALFPQRQRH